MSVGILVESVIILPLDCSLLLLVLDGHEVFLADLPSHSAIHLLDRSSRLVMRGVAESYMY